MVVAQASRSKSQQLPPVRRNKKNQAEDTRPKTSSDASSQDDAGSIEMEALSGVNDRTFLFPTPEYDAHVTRSRSENLGNSQPEQRKNSPSPSRRATNFLRKISQRVPKLPKSPTFANFASKNDQYGHLDTKDDTEYEQDPIGVDLSSLTGLGFQLTKAPEIFVSEVSQSEQFGAESNQSDHSKPLPDRSISLGRGVRDGIQLRLDPSAAVVRAKSLRHPSSATAADEIQRAKSIRNLAQDLARRTQQVVAIDDIPLPGSAVDLSLLEGTERCRKKAASFDEMTPNGQSSAARNTRSYFYPEDPNPPNWKPFTMRSPFILLLIILSLALAIVQEWLCQLSLKLEAKNDGILSFNRVTDISTWSFFCWKYLPTMIFVFYGVLWHIMDFEIKRLEPYYQLSRPTGSSAIESLNLDHLSIWSYIAPIKSFRLRQWAVFFSSVGNLLTTIVSPSLQNPSVRFDENENCEVNGCPPDELNFFVRIDPGWSRALTAFLVMIAICGMVLLVQLRRKSGLLSDPKGIAGIAAMATKSHILNDFQGMDLATHREIHKRLQHRRYLLYMSSIWQGEYDQSRMSRYEGGRNLESPHPMMLRLSAGIPFIAFLAFCLLAVPIINFTPARIIPNTVPWLPIMIATLIKIAWTAFESDVRMMEPFYILSKGNAPPEMSLTLDYQGTVYGWFPFKALLNRHYIVALVGVSSILADLLTVTVSSFSVNGAGFLHSSSSAASSSKDETFKSFWGAVILSIVVLSFLILSAALVYALRRHPFLPRQPSTIAAVLAFIHASRMLDDFIDTERLSNKDMEKRLKAIGKRYGLGWFKGRDGQTHCAIDEEPMQSKYVHGKPYTMAREPWHDAGGGMGSGGGYFYAV